MLLAACVLSACTTKSKDVEQLESPDPYAAQAPAAADEGDPAVAQAGQADLSTVCADAEPVALAVERDGYRVPRLGQRGFAGLANYKPYTMKDLEALAKRKQYAELLAHIGDVPPAQRTDRWDAMLATAATAMVEKSAESSGYAVYEGFMIAESALTQNPALSEDDAFMAARAKAGKSSFQQCFADSYRGDACLSSALDFIAVDGTSPEVKLEIAKIVRLNQNHAVSVPFFAAALDGADAKSVCGDEDLHLAVRAGLALPPDYDNAKLARDIAAGSCFAQVRSVVEGALQENPNSYVRDNNCAVLAKNGAL